MSTLFNKINWKESRLGTVLEEKKRKKTYFDLLTEFEGERHFSSFDLKQSLHFVKFIKKKNHFVDCKVVCEEFILTRSF